MECFKNLSIWGRTTSIEETEALFKIKPGPDITDKQPPNMNYDNRRFIDLKSPKKLYKQETKSFYPN